MGAALRWVGLIAVILACAVDILYVSQIIGPPGRRGDSFAWRSTFVAFFIDLCVDGKLTIRQGDCNHMGASIDPSGHVTAVNPC